VIPTCGRRSLVQRCLGSLAHQEGAPPFEVLVVDDGAEPALGEHVARWGLGIRVEVLHHASRRGRSATRNTGIARSRGEIVVFLDGDMEVVPGFLAAHAAAHRSGEEVVLGRILTAPELRRGAFARYVDSRAVEKVPPGERIPARYLMTGNCSVARALLERAGGFDEEFTGYGGEDTEMGYRLEAHGGRFVHAPEALAFHLDLPSVPRMAERLRRYGEEALPILVRKAPRAREELRLYLAEPIAPGSDGPGRVAAKLLARLVCHRTFWAPAARLGALLPAALPVHALYDFVRAAAYLDGYRRALRRGSPAGAGEGAA
jgi:glycosyltransferase involved in cell wall biosynthesis